MADRPVPAPNWPPNSRPRRPRLPARSGGSTGRRPASTPRDRLPCAAGPWTWPRAAARSRRSAATPWTANGRRPRTARTSSAAAQVPMGVARAGARAGKRNRRRCLRADGDHRRALLASVNRGCRAITAAAEPPSTSRTWALTGPPVFRTTGIDETEAITRMAGGERGDDPRQGSRDEPLPGTPGDPAVGRRQHRVPSVPLRDRRRDGHEHGDDRLRPPRVRVDRAGNRRSVRRAVRQLLRRQEALRGQLPARPRQADSRRGSCWTRRPCARSSSRRRRHSRTLPTARTCSVPWRPARLPSTHSSRTCWRRSSSPAARISPTSWRARWASPRSRPAKTARSTPSIYMPDCPLAAVGGGTGLDTPARGAGRDGCAARPGAAGRGRAPAGGDRRRGRPGRRTVLDRGVHVARPGAGPTSGWAAPARQAPADRRP